MKTEWNKAKKIFGDARKLAPAERSTFLDRVCADDEETRLEVESLLNFYDETDDFLEQPLISNATEWLNVEQTQNAEGKNFGNYEIIKQIGVGGMGEVYLAADKKLDRKVAIKILYEKFAKHESNLQRFIQEAKSASALNHPNILVIHEIGVSEKAHYIVSEFVEGKTLREVLSEKSLLLTDVLDISIQITNALTVTHAAKIVHRDIKPENIIIRPDGLVKILDFGLAKLVEQKVTGMENSTLKQNQTAKGIILGTINYMSPEQAKGKKVDEQTDIFSLGIVIYEMLTGKTPFAGESMSETFANLIKAEPLPLSYFTANVPDELQRIVSKTLQKNKDERYQTMKELFADLKDLRESVAFNERLKKSQLPKDKNITAVLPVTTEETDHRTAEMEYNFVGWIKRNKMLAVFATILFVVVIGLTYQFYNPGKSVSEGKKSLAVLPFVNASQDPNAEYLSDGIAESVINRLSQISNLKVMSRNSAFRFKNNQNEIKNIASQLGVETLVMGDVKQVGDKLVINVRLIDARDDSTIWGNQYVKTSGDIITVQNEIAQAVTDNLRVKLSESDLQRLNKNYTANAEAYQLYLRGRFHLLKTTRAGFQASIPLFQQAINIEPNYALAYVGLADAYRSLALAGEMPAQEVMPLAKEAANKALEIDSSLAEAHAAVGLVIFWYDWDWKAAENHFKRSIELDPNNAEAHNFYAGHLSSLAHYSEALTEARRAGELDPLNLRTLSLESRYLIYAGKTDEALSRLEKTLELDPDYWFALQFRAEALLEKGMYAEAVVSARKSLENNFNTRTIAYLVYALAKSGKTAEAQKELENLLALSEKQYVPPYNIAIIYNGLGESVESLKWLEKAIERRDPRMTYLNVEPTWKNLQKDTRFQEILRRVGF